jgi:hypothetical protein
MGCVYPFKKARPPSSCLEFCLKPFTPFEQRLWQALSRKYDLPSGESVVAIVCFQLPSIHQFLIKCFVYSRRPGFAMIYFSRFEGMS